MYAWIEFWWGRVNCAAGSFILTSFTQLAEPMTATLADLSQLTRRFSAFTAFYGHFLSTFAAFRSGICAVPFWLLNQQTCALDFSRL
jgi:hypothetical protein